MRLPVVVALTVAGLLSQEPQALRLAVPGGELAYDVAGAGETMVLLHGAFMDRRSWDAQMPAFTRRFRVVRYDIRPFGESNRLDAAYSVPDDILRMLDHLTIERAHLVGHSFGGGAALDFALLHPDRVATLTLAAAGPGGFVAPEDERKAAMAVFAALRDGDDALLNAWLAHPMWSVARGRPAVIDSIAASTRRNLPVFRRPTAPFVPVMPPAISRLGDVKAPTLVVVGDKDTPGNQDASALLAKQIPGASLKVIAGADHALPLGWSDEFNAAVLAFIAAARR